MLWFKFKFKHLEPIDDLVSGRNAKKFYSKAEKTVASEPGPEESNTKPVPKGKAKAAPKAPKRKPKTKANKA